MQVFNKLEKQIKNVQSIPIFGVQTVLFLVASNNCGTLAISRVQKRWGYLSPTARKDLLAASSLLKTKSVRHTKAMRPTSFEAMSSRTKKKAIPVVWVDGGVAFLSHGEAFFPFSTKKSATTTLHIANAAWFDCCLLRQGRLRYYFSLARAFFEKGLWLRAVKGRTKLGTLHTFSKVNLPLRAQVRKWLNIGD